MERNTPDETGRSNVCQRLVSEGVVGEEMTMKTIWKFTLSDGSPQRVSMPKGAEILAVQQQGGVARLWAMVDPSQDMETRYVEVFGTGQTIHQDMGIERKYIGTFQQPPFVWHVFERL